MANIITDIIIQCLHDTIIKNRATEYDTIEKIDIYVAPGLYMRQEAAWLELKIPLPSRSTGTAREPARIMHQNLLVNYYYQ